MLAAGAILIQLEKDLPFRAVDYFDKRPGMDERVVHIHTQRAYVCVCVCVCVCFRINWYISAGDLFFFCPFRRLHRVLHTPV